MLTIFAALAAAAGPAPAEMMAIYKAAGAVKRGTKWVLCADQPDPDGVRVENSHIVMPELPGIGFEGKSDLIKVMRQLAE